MNLRDTITVLRATAAAGPYNSTDARDWTGATQTVLAASVQPLTATEATADQQRTEVLATVYLYGDADIVATDRVRYRSVDYEVIRVEVPWSDRNGTRHNRQVVIRQITGG